MSYLYIDMYRVKPIFSAILSFTVLFARRIRNENIIVNVTPKSPGSNITAHMSLGASSWSVNARNGNAFLVIFVSLHLAVASVRSGGIRDDSTNYNGGGYRGRGLNGA